MKSCEKLEKVGNIWKKWGKVGKNIIFPKTYVSQEYNYKSFILMNI